MDSLLRAILRAFGRFQRPIAWSVLVGGVASFIAVLANIVQTGEAKLATLLGSLVLAAEGFSMAQAVENELDSPGAADDSD